jgi:hypothetical protein
MRLLFNRTLGWVFYRDIERNGEVRNILNEIESSAIESESNWTAFSIKWRTGGISLINWFDLAIVYKEDGLVIGNPDLVPKNLSKESL